MKNTKKTIASDFDGVLHKYSMGWSDGTIYDVPVEGAREKIIMLLDAGFEVVVFTTRKDKKAIGKWLEHWDFPPLPITNEKIPALAYIDDRALRFTNWEDTVKYFI